MGAIGKFLNNLSTQELIIYGTIAGVVTVLIITLVCRCCCSCCDKRTGPAPQHRQECTHRTPPAPAYTIQPFEGYYPPKPTPNAFYPPPPPYYQTPYGVPVAHEKNNYSGASAPSSYQQASPPTEAYTRQDAYNPNV